MLADSCGQHLASRWLLTAVTVVLVISVDDILLVSLEGLINRYMFTSVVPINIHGDLGGVIGLNAEQWK